MLIGYKIMCGAGQMYQNISFQLWCYMFSNACFKKSMESLYPAIGGWVVWWSIKFILQSKFLGYLFKHVFIDFGPHYHSTFLMNLQTSSLHYICRLV